MTKTCEDVATGLTEGLADIVKEHFDDELTHRTTGKTGATIDLEKLKVKVFVDAVDEGGQTNNANGNIRITVRLHGGLEVLRFTMAFYPACCAMVQCNQFSYDCILVNREMVHAIMDHLMNKLIVYWYGNLKRVVFNFVESQYYRNQKYGYAHFGDTNLSPEQTDLRDVKYPWLYEWAISKRHQQLLTVNHNTNRIIHFVDCMVELPK